MKSPPEEADCTSDLAQWYHSWDKKSLADMALKQIWDMSKYITFVFHQKSANAIAKPLEKEDDDKENYDVEEDEESSYTSDYDE